MRRRVWIAVWLVSALYAPTAAHAQTSVTIAARSCPSYESITANLARNDIQESLRDLGEDTRYRPGQPIDPDVEASGQPLCAPLPNWRFTLGRGYRTRAVTGAWGSLSIVTSPFSDSIVTRDSVPLLNAAGADTGRDLAGAVRIELTQEEANLASRHALWLQGGTTNDPVLDTVYPHQYGFAALRCVTDNLNGDNVEYIAIPTGARNVFCFAYYVTPPPTSGTIVIDKVDEAPADTAAHDFSFQGNLSFNANGVFVLDAAPGRPASQTFYRAAVPAGGTPWTVHEIAEPGWSLLGLDCVSQSGASSTQIPAGSADVSIFLAAGDTVTCTYRDGLQQPPPSGLTLGKVTLGDTGSAEFHVTGPGLSLDAPIATTEADRPTYLELPPFPPGDYEISETPDERPGGHWVRSQLRCNGRIVAPLVDPLPVTLAQGAGSVCVYVNTFRPSGVIRVRKITEGATGAAAFTIRPLDADPPQVYLQQATTTRQGVAAPATGDDTDGIPIGTYDIQESAPSNAGSGDWRLELVTCDGIPVGSAQGRIRVRLSADQPEADCTFTNVRSSTPGEEGGDGGGGGGGGGDEGGREGATSDAATNLKVTKRVRPTDIAPGGSGRYTVTVSNTSDVTARDVVVDELQPPSHRFVNVEAPAGVRCRGTRPLRCVLGTLGPHARIVLRATVRTRLTGRVVNRVAVHTSTRETRLSDNAAHAVLRIHTTRPAACASRVRC
jgi:uncharacterized repeat protein (TIGR01451 family)